MLRQALDSLALFSPTFRRVMMRTWYESLVILDRDKQITFMNYGYSELEPTENQLALNDQESVNRYAIQLYHHVASAIDLADKAVVEIGSGRGGGAAYVTRNLKPQKMIGVDVSTRAVAFCNQRYSNETLEFIHGDAESVPLGDAAVDAVINIESSHCYGSMSNFLSEVHRILRPQGFFMFADHRDYERLPLLREQLTDAGFEVLADTDITQNVVKALELDDDRRRQMIREKCPAFLRREAEEFAALTGTRTYESFRSGESGYFSFLLRRNNERINGMSLNTSRSVR